MRLRLGGERGHYGVFGGGFFELGTFFGELCGRGLAGLFGFGEGGLFLGGFLLGFGELLCDAFQDF